LWTAICPISGSGLSPALSAFLPFQSLVTECSCRDQLLAPLPSSCGLKAPHPLCHVFLFSPLFIIQFFFFFQGQGSVCPGGYAVLSQGGCGNTAYCLFAHLLVCRMSPKQVWSWCLVAQEPSCFICVTWCGEILYGMGVQGVEALIPLGAFFCLVWLQHLSKVFDSQSSCCLFLHHSHHLDPL
jgi:hypothetical protein